MNRPSSGRAAVAVAQVVAVPTPDGAADAGEIGEPGEASADEAFEVRATEVDAAGHGERLDKLLVRLAPEFSRSHLQGLIKGGHVRVDGRAASRAAARLQAGQRLDLELVPTDESRAFTPQPLPLAIVHEDDALMVIDKRAGWVVHPAPGNWSGTVLNALLAHHPGAAALPRAGIVHRLDKDTSGLMVVAKTLAAATALVRAIAERRVHRRYLAIVHGTPAARRLRLEQPIGRDPASRLRMAVVASGKPARTDVELVAAGEGCAALQCTLHTGRTHQIRVHLAHAGHPLVADPTYGGRPALDLQRQALHAIELELEHPDGKGPRRFSALPPEDFAAAWRRVAGAPPRWRAAAAAPD